MKPMDKLLKCIPTLEPIEFAGLARLLGVRLIEVPKEGDPYARSFTDILADVLDKFEHSNRAAKRQVLQLVDKRGSKPREDINASNSENT
jgi:hypothetical protein